MRIAFRKITDERHALEIASDGGPCEQVECETRSYLVHDLLHYAVEAEAGLRSGFWGSLARGRTLAEMNDRTGAMSGDPEMAAIEQIVGPLHPSTKGRSPREVAEGMRRFAESLGTTMPAWLDEAFVASVQERMRRLLGQWRDTRCGERLELAWPPSDG
jgi:hypothetical protein